MLQLLALGNPKKQYHNTWHNIAVHFVDFYAQKYNLQLHPKKEYVLFTDNKHIQLLYLQNTFMNNNGQTFWQIIKKTPANYLAIAHDEYNIPVGEYKITTRPTKQHNGITSILKNFDLTRFQKTLWIKIGTKTPETNLMPKHKYVLSYISPKYLDLMNQSFEKLSNHIYTLSTKPYLIDKGYS